MNKRKRHAGAGYKNERGERKDTKEGGKFWMQIQQSLKSDLQATVKRTFWNILSAQSTLSSLGVTLLTSGSTAVGRIMLVFY